MMPRAFTVDDLRDALEACFVPGSARSVVADGLVRDLRLEEDTDAPGSSVAGNPQRCVAHILLGPLDAEAQQMLAVQIMNRLAGIEAISRSDVRFAAPLLPILS